MYIISGLALNFRKMKFKSEKSFKEFVNKTAEIVPRRLLPKVKKDQAIAGRNVYPGYPTKIKYVPRQRRSKTVGELDRLFERVPNCVIKFDRKPIEKNQYVGNWWDYKPVEPKKPKTQTEITEWEEKMLKLDEELDYDQLYWNNSDWEYLWHHTFSAEGHLPVDW